MATVKIENLRKSFGPVEILHGLSFDIADGEFLVLVGPSGCGKTTLLRMLAGLEEISDGLAYIGNDLVNDVPAQKRDVAMVFQNYALYPHMSVAENMGFSLKLAGYSKQDIAQNVARAAEILDITPLLDRRPSKLSGGQRQRVAMGRAIVRQPRVFLFDEPLSNLDAKLRVQMRTEMKALHQRLATTTIYVTHDQVEAMSMADRIVIMNHGRIEQIGTPMDLYDNPETLFVAEFIGTPGINLLHGHLDTSTEAATLVLDDGKRIPIGPDITTAPNGHPVILGIRPEDIILDPGPEITVPGAELMAQALFIEPTGSETLVTLNWGETQLISTSKQRLNFGAGAQVTFAFNPERHHLFDGASGQRIHKRPIDSPQTV